MSHRKKEKKKHISDASGNKILLNVTIEGKSHQHLYRDMKKHQAKCLVLY